MIYKEIICDHYVTSSFCPECDHYAYMVLHDQDGEGVLLYLKSGDYTEWYYKEKGEYIIMIEEFLLLPEEGKRLYAQWQFQKELDSLLDEKD